MKHKTQSKKLGQNKCQVKERMNEANEREKVIHPKAIW
jgi:hypothetical protein